MHLFFRFKQANRQMVKTTLISALKNEYKIYFGNKNTCQQKN